MTGQDYRKAMECFTPAPSLRERAAAAAEPGKRPRVRPWRTWLVAAVVCMALVGMAVAAKSPELLLFWENKPDIGDGYSVQYTVEFLPADTFSPEVAALAAAEEPNHHKYFDTWDEMEQFIGLDLADNPVLDEAEPGSLGTQPWDMDHTEQGTTHILLLPVCEDDGELSIVQCMGSYVLDGVFQRGCKIRISREGKQIYEGELASLKRFKDDVKEVKAGYECGLVFEKFNEIQELDVVESYTMVEVPR